MQHNMHRTRAGLAATLLAICAILLVVFVKHASTQSSGGEGGPPTDVATLVKTTHTSQFSPPSPDPSGLVYLPASGSLLISDAEVNEVGVLFTGDNLFETTLGGSLQGTLTTIPFSDEPTGVALNPANNHLFFSDDTGTRGFYELDPGPDGLYDTDDDTVTFINTQLFGSMDPEGLTFDSWQGHLFLADGADGGGAVAIFEIDPGPNGVFDGVAPDGDDIVTAFDAVALGVANPEGIAFNHHNGHLYILSGQGPLIAETLTDGTLLRYIDVSELDGRSLAGLAYAPASEDPAAWHLYIVDRGVDNDTDPDENDGVLFEVAFPLNVDNLPPAVDAGPDQIVDYPQDATLEGTVADDGNPDPPAMVTTTWTKVNGPGTVTIVEADALSTTAAFSATGTYVLRLTASDGELSTFDEVSYIVIPADFLYIPVLAFELEALSAERE